MGMRRQIRRGRLVALAAALVACAAARPALAEDGWPGSLGGFLRAQPAPEFVAGEVWAPELSAGSDAGSSAFSAPATRLAPEAIEIAVRADVDRLTLPPHDPGSARPGGLSGTAVARIGGAFERFATLDAEGVAYGSRNFLRQAPAAAKTAIADSKWTPEASLSLVAQALPASFQPTP
jgi:hypothetical protein